MKEPIKRFLKRQPWMRRLRLANIERRTLTAGYPRWSDLLGSDTEALAARVRAARGGPRVLVATSVGAHLPAATLDSLLAVALTLRGAEVHILLCDSALPACMRCEADLYPDQARFVETGPTRDLCKVCFDPAADMFSRLGFTVHTYSGFLTTQDERWVANEAASRPIAEVAGAVLDEHAVGQHALAGALRFFARGTLAGEPHADAVLRRFFAASMLSTMAARRIFQTHRFAALVAHHGIYVPQGNICEAAKQSGVRVVTWHQAYRERCFIFSHDDTYHHTLMNEPVDAWAELPWSAERERQVMEYLESRRSGGRDWISFQKASEFDMDRFARRRCLDVNKPWIAALTNVVWDAQLHYPDNAFNGMMDWLVQTIRYFEGRPELQLIIRVHPAEVLGTLPSRQRVEDELRAAFERLPGNVCVVGPDDGLSTYSLVDRCNAALIYGTKMGVELSSRGIPVIVAGEAWVRGKGVTTDVSSPGEYFTALEALPHRSRMTPEAIERARKYAFHFFFRRMIPLEFMEPQAGWPNYRVGVRGLGDLERGASVGLDVIAEGILAGRPFIFPAEERAP